MIEGVTSAVANAQVVKSSVKADAVSASAKIDVQVADIPSAPYISPYIKMDTSANKAVIQVRDSDTGDVLRQFPSESAIKARQIADAERERAENNRQVQSQLKESLPSVAKEEVSVSFDARQAVNALTAASVSSGSAESQSTTSISA